MKFLLILFSTLLLNFSAFSASHKEGGHSHDEITTNGISSEK